jgi:tetratricopeptide (TPR) repeat protein
VKLGAVAVTATLLFAAAGAARAESSEHAIAEGRYHLRKANGLAGDDRCQAAIHEYTLAYKKLRDPVVLFNRGECYRRIGEDDKAVADYRAFLAAVPAAPNRAQIEAKIATLTAAPTATPRTPADVNPAPLAGTGGARSNGASAGRAERSTTPPPVHPAATASPFLPAERPPVIEDAPAPAALAPPASLVQATPAASAASPALPEGEGHHGKTWIWLAFGAAVAGGAVGAYFALRTPATVPPSTELGNYKF